MKPLLGASSFWLAFTVAASAQIPAGGEFRVNTYTTSHQSQSRMAVEPDGDFVIVWTSHGQDGDRGGIFGQRFAASGMPRGSEFRINTYTPGSQKAPAIAVGREGDFVVVWDSPQDGSDTAVLGQRFDAAGSAIGGEFQVNVLTTGSQFGPVVGRADDGRFVVSWSSWFADGYNLGIAARRFDASGSPVGGELVVNSHTFGSQLLGDIAVDVDGNFVVVWQELVGFTWLDGIFGQRYEASGNRLGGEFQVNTYTTDAQSYPSVSMSPAGGFVVAWMGSGDGDSLGVFARRFDIFGNPLGNDFAVNTYTTGVQVIGDVSHDARGNFIVAWTSYSLPPTFSSTFAQRFSASGARRGAEFRVNTFTTDRQAMASVGCDAVGNFVVAWNSRFQDGSDWGVFAQRFGGLGPATLAVDTAGNQVLEPGETVDVRPSWRNMNGAAQTFSGTLTDITGPAGATYTITDPAGDYGTVADGATAPCTDCYCVSVSNPPTRPVLHWDASAVESIVPDTQGQQKEWRLHVGASFTDVPTASGFYRFIETLLHHDITSGCGPTDFCPASAMSREQMAVFVLVAKEGAGYVPPACTTPVFADVPPTSPFCRWVEELARRGVVAGCGGGKYCPTEAVAREQMAVFVLLTLDPVMSPPACTAPIYGDVPAASPFCRWIEELTRRGVVTGCGGGNYCPAAPVSREQMSVFLAVTFGLTLYGP